MNIQGLLRLVLVLFTLATAVSGHASDLASKTTEPEFTDLNKSFSGNVLTSNTDPAATLKFDNSLKYLGGQKFVLYGLAGVEQHFLIDADEQGNLRSFYWVHFEEYLPGFDYTYDYSDAPLQTDLSGYEFSTFPGVITNFDPHSKSGKGTDFFATREFLANKGYLLPTDWISTKLVHITDEAKQKELMMIVITDLEQFALNASEKNAIQSNTEVQQKVQQIHINSIKSNLKLTPLKTGN